MAYLLSEEELQAARTRIAMVRPDPDPTPAPAFVYRPRSERQWYNRAHQSWQGDAQGRKARKKSAAPVPDPTPTLDSLVTAANEVRHICSALVAEDYAALRLQVAAYSDAADAASFCLLTEDFPAYLHEIITAIEHVRSFLLAIDPTAPTAAGATTATNQN